MSPRVSASQIKKRAKNNFVYWRLIYEGGLSPSEVFAMDEELLMEADAAFDIHINRMNKAMKSSMKK